MKKTTVSGILLSTSLLTSGNLMAHEGMWLLTQVKNLMAKDLKEQGIKLTAQQIYDINQSSIKDAVVHFGGFCSGEIVSNQGLILTNHHCGYSPIQTISSVEKNYLRDGYWAKNGAEEVPVPGLFVQILDRMENVTEKVLQGVTPATTELERIAIVQKNIAQIEQTAKVSDAYAVYVRDMYVGSEYYLFVFKQYNDIRLVGTPEESIGKFGGDTDNWAWPRHTGDFSIFRIYADKNGNPANYSADNKPYKPKYYFPISLKGIKQGDLSMIVGFPGNTDRYMTSWEADMAVVHLPLNVKLRALILETLKVNMDKSEAIRLKYASKYAHIANYWKNKDGQAKGMVKNKVADKKRTLENQVNTWISQTPERKAKYGEALNMMQQGIMASADYRFVDAYTTDMLARKSAAIDLGVIISKISPWLNNPNLKANEMESVLVDINTFFNSYDYETAKSVAVAVLNKYNKDVAVNLQAPIFSEAFKNYPGNTEKFVDDVLFSSILLKKEALLSLIQAGNVDAIKADKGFQMVKGMLNHTKSLWTKEDVLLFVQGKRLFLEALREMNAPKPLYPDANGTIRFTYGNVKGFSPADGIEYDWYTTQEGLLEKENPNDEEFILSPALKAKIEAKDFGMYADKTGNLVLCFLTDHDITGGNSGSVVFNAKGEVIGCAFDGVEQDLMGDIYVDMNVKRTISVDIRYVLFLMDKVGGAGHLLKEMKIIK
jgi:hypothetical protein